MTSHNKDPLQIVITQDKLVDILLHAATREDIAKLDAKIDNVKSDLEAKMDKLDAKIDRIMWGIVVAIIIPIATQYLSHFLK